MTLTPPRDINREVSEALRELTELYMSTPAALAQSHRHQMDWIATRLVDKLNKLGWAPISPANETYPVRIDFGVQIPDHHVVPCSSAKHAVEVANRSTDGAQAVWRAQGPWRTDLENMP